MSQIRTPGMLLAENADFRMALADIAYSRPDKVTVERLQELAANALEKWSYREGIEAFKRRSLL